MKINSPTTIKKGEAGLLVIEEVDFETKQDVVARFDQLNRRIMLTSIALLSTSASSISNGATLSVREVNPNTWTNATTTLTSNGTLAADGTTVTLGNRTYTLKTALTASTTANEVLLGAAAADTLDNLKAAVNGSAGGGTLYGSLTTAHTQITATTNTDTTQLFVASLAPGRAGNDLACADTTSATLTWSGTTFAGGLDGTLVNALVDSVDLADSDDTGNIQRLSFATDNEFLTGGNAVMLSITTGSTATTDVKQIVIGYVFID